VPDEPRSFDELVDALKEHPEWRHDLREMFPEEGEGGAPPPQPGRSKAWIPTLAMGVLLGAIIAGVVAFVLMNDDDDDDTAVAAEPSASPAASPSASASPAGSPATRTAQAVSPTPTLTTAASTPTPTAAPPTPTSASATNPPQPTATQPPAQTPNPTQPPPPSTPSFTFAGFQGACAPVSGVVTVQNVTQPITMAATWTGPTTINVGPFTIQPEAPGTVFTVGFPTVAPLTPGTYTFTATADGAVVATGSTNITC
jgi:hypothetical protein